MTLPPIEAKARLDASEFLKGAQEIRRAVADLQKMPKTLELTADMGAARAARSDIDELHKAADRRVSIQATVNGASAVKSLDDQIKDLNAQVRANRDLWQANVLSNEEAGASARKLRDDLLALASAQDISAQQMVKATNAAASAQRTLDATKGQSTRGGFAYSASIGIIEALGNMGGPAGAAAGMVGQYIVQGLQGAMERGKPEVSKEADEVSAEIVRAMKERLKIQSPSKVMEEIGRFAMEGLISGFKSKQPELEAVIKGTAQTIPEAFVVGSLGENLAAPLLDSMAVSLEVLPEIFSKSFAGAAPAAVDAVGEVADTVEMNVAPAFDTLALGFESASSRLAGIAEATQPAEEAMNGVASAAGEAGDEAEAAGEQAAEGGNGFEQLSGYLAVAAAGVTAFAGALAVAVPKAAEFQKAMQNIAAESDLTQTDLQEIGDGLLDVSSKTGIAAKELAAATYDIVGAGVAGADTNAAVIKLAEQSAYLAKAGLTDVATSADVLTSALNAYNLSAEQATYVSDALITVVNTGKVSLDQMGGALTEVFPLAAALGVNIEELGAAVAGLTSIGVPAEQAVTGIRGALDNIMDPSDGAKKTAKELGIEFSATALKAKGLSQFLNEVSAATQGSTAIMAELFTDVEAINAVFGLTGEAGARKFTDALTAQASAAGATAEAYEDVAASYESSQARFTESINNLQIEFGQKFLPVLTKASNGLADLIGNIDELAKNTGVQFIAVVGGAVLLADAMMKVTAATKAAVVTSGAFQAVTNAGGVVAYTKALFGMQAGLTGVAGAGGAATVALTPLATVALAVGSFFGGWKVGEWIGKMKLFGDEVMTVNDGLTDVFTKWIMMSQGFSADEAAQAVAELRVQDMEAARQQADANVDVSDAVNAVAKAERAAKEDMEQANNERVKEVERARDQKKALQELSDTLEGRKFELKIDGMSEMEADLAQLGKEFDKLRENVKKPFYLPDGTLDMTPGLQGKLDELDAQRKAEEASIRDGYAQEAAKTAGAAALAAQQAEIEAMQEGAAKKAALRELEIQKIEEDAKAEAAKLAEFPEQRAKFEESTQARISAMRRQWANEDAEDARKAAEERVKAEREAAERILAVRREARDAEIAAMPEGTARDQAERQAGRADERAKWQERLSEAERGSAEYEAIRSAFQRTMAAKERQWAAEDAKAAEEAARRIAQAWAQAAEAQGAAKIAALEKQQAQYELQLARQIASAGKGTEEAARLEAQGINKRFELEAQAAEQGYQNQRRQRQLVYREAISEEGISAQERLAIQQQYHAELAAMDDQYLTGAFDRLAQQEEAERQAAERIKAARLEAAQKPIQAAEREGERLNRALELVRSDEQYAQVQTKISDNLKKQVGEQQKLLSQANALGMTTQQRQEVEGKIEELQHQQALALKEQEDRAQRLADLAKQRRDAEAAYAVAVAKTDAELTDALEQQLRNKRSDRDKAEIEATTAGTAEKRDEAAQRYLQLNQEILGLEKQIAEVPLAGMERRNALAAALTAEYLEQKGLSDNAVAQAQAGLVLAEQQLVLAQKQAAQANAKGTQAEQEAAALALSEARLNVAQARRGVEEAIKEEGKKQADEAQKAEEQSLEALKKQIAAREQALDLAKARVQAEAQVRGLGDDAVYQAELDLEINRQRSEEVARQLAQAQALKLTLGEQAQLTQEQATLARELRDLEQKRSLAIYDRYQAEKGLLDARKLLSEAQQGQGDQALVAATRSLADARRELYSAELEYQRVLANPARSPEAELAATNKLTDALLKRQQAMRGIAEAYEQTISKISGIQSAAERLNKAVNGEGYDPNREMQRLQAIEQRRQTAARRLQEALAAGNRELIQQTADAYAEQEERYQAQVKKMEERTGERVYDAGKGQAQRLADQLDRLGIEGDREAARLTQRQQAIDREVEALSGYGVSVDEMGQHITRFGDAVADLGRLQTGAAPAPDAGGKDRVLSIPELTGLRQDMTAIFTGLTPLVPALNQLQQSLGTLTPVALSVPTVQAAPAQSYVDNTQFNPVFQIYDATDPNKVAAVVEGKLQELRTEAQRQKRFEGGCPKGRQ